ncbi:hypothetical protein JCM19235_4540 [Vibrio maritimus]|uniref:Uncharacterized protein n=1 Tax=Vibrio maritimus TaxID=990268 RepID=A0A090RXZ5_9VIBR|nr:hypothetical protein JCM19235_4540 [Vibrio maritimus]
MGGCWDTLGSESLSRSNTGLAPFQAAELGGIRWKIPP